MVGHVPLDVANGDRRVEFAASAGGLARMDANPPANGRQHIVLADQRKRLGVATRVGQRHIPLGVDPQRTVGLTQRLAAFVDHGAPRQTLAAGDANRLDSGRGAHRADGHALPAQGAPSGIDKSRLGVDAHVKPLRVVAHRTNRGRQQATDAGIAQNPDQPRPMGIVEGDAGLEPVGLVGQFQIEIGGAVDQNHRNAQLAQFVGGGQAGGGGTDHHDTV